MQYHLPYAITFLNDAISVLHSAAPDDEAFGCEICRSEMDNLIQCLKRNLWVQGILYDVNFHTFIRRTLKIQKDRLMAKLNQELSCGGSTHSTYDQLPDECSCNYDPDMLRSHNLSSDTLLIESYGEL